jgi:hypothetical protein
VLGLWSPVGRCAASSRATSGYIERLRVLAGLDSIDSGEVLIKGRPVTGLRSAERRMAMVFQTSGLIMFLDVSRNLGSDCGCSDGRKPKWRSGPALGPGSCGSPGCCPAGRVSCPVVSAAWPAWDARKCRSGTSSCWTNPLGDLDAVQRTF